MAPAYHKTHWKRWGASPPTFSSGFCSSWKPFRPPKSAISGLKDKSWSSQHAWYGSEDGHETALELVSGANFGCVLHHFSSLTRWNGSRCQVRPETGQKPNTNYMFYLYDKSWSSQRAGAPRARVEAARTPGGPADPVGGQQPMTPPRAPAIPIG
jgi:hypothetical protein